MKGYREMFRASFFDLARLKEARNISWGKTWGYFFFLTLIFALPITTDLWTSTQQLFDDVQEVSKKIPDFEIKNGKLESASTGFIYQTNDFIFTFDPEGKRKVSDIEADGIVGAWGISFLKDEFVITFPKEIEENLPQGQKPIALSYDSETFKNVNGERLKKGMARLEEPYWAFPIILLACILPALIRFLYQLFLVTVGGLIYTKTTRMEMTFGEIFKTVLFVSTAPLILTTLLVFLFPSLEIGFIQALMTMFLFFKVIKGQEQTKGEL